MKELISPKTEADARSIYIPADRFMTVAHDGLSGTEEITFRMKMGGVMQDIKPKVSLTANRNMLQIAGPLTYEVIKPVTANAVGVYIEE